MKKILQAFEILWRTGPGSGFIDHVWPRGSQVGKLSPNSATQRLAIIEVVVLSAIEDKYNIIEKVRTRNENEMKVK